MVTSYPVNDYRGYLAHKAPSFSNAANWNEADQHKYYKREWTGSGWRYYYTKEEYDAAHKKEPSSSERREAREERAEQYKNTNMTPGQKRVAANQAGRDAGKTVAKGVDTAVDAVKNGMNKASKAVKGAYDATSEAVKGAYDATSEAIGSAIDWVSDFGDQQGKVYETEERFENGETVEVPLDGTNGTQKKYANTIAGNTVRIANDIASWAAQAFNDVKSWITGAAQNIGSWFNDRKNDLINKYREVQSFVNGFAAGLQTSPQVRAVIGTIREGFGAVTSAMVGAMRTAGSAIGTAANSIASFASDIFNGFADLFGLNDQINHTLSAAELRDSREERAEEYKKNQK